MSAKKKSTEKTRLHPRNKHRDQYDLTVLTELVPELSGFIAKNKYGNDTVDFFNPSAVTALNKALLLRHYGLKNWSIPAGYLCPPIPGRADYIHHMADILTGRNFGNIPTGAKINVLDLGVGANNVYPIIGNAEYGWSFVGSDIDPVALSSAEAIVQSNPHLGGKIELRLQAKKSETFFGIIKKDERFDLTICNPPFHASAEDAQAGSERKAKNLKGKKNTKVVLNFGGTSDELWTEGGEKAFIVRMIKQSSQFAKSCCWFSTLVSKQSNVAHIQSALEKIGVMDQRVIPMGQGNKTSRIVAWTFLKKFEQKEWALERWAEKTEPSVEPSEDNVKSPKKAKVGTAKEKTPATEKKVTVVKAKAAPKAKTAAKKEKTPVVEKKATAAKAVPQTKVTVKKEPVAKVKTPVAKKKAAVPKVKIPVEKKKASPAKEKKAVEKKAVVAKVKAPVSEKKVAVSKEKAPVSKKKEPVAKVKTAAAKKKAAVPKEKKK